MRADQVLIEHHTVLRALCKKVTTTPADSPERQDRVDEVMGVSQGQFERVPPTFSDSLRPYVLGAYKMSGRILVALDSDAILAIAAVKKPL